MKMETESRQILVRDIYEKLRKVGLIDPELLVNNLQAYFEGAYKPNALTYEVMDSSGRKIPSYSVTDFVQEVHRHNLSKEELIHGLKEIFSQEAKQLASAKEVQTVDGQIKVNPGLEKINRALEKLNRF